MRTLPAAPVALPRREHRRSEWIIMAVILVQFACQLALLTHGDSSIRVLYRAASYGISLCMLPLILTASIRSHPSGTWGIWILLMLCLQFFHPETTGWVPAVGTIVLYAAVLSPLWWVTTLQVSAEGFRRVLLLIWAFQSISSFFGVLQVLFPGQFQPTLSAMIEMQGAVYIDGLRLTLPNGARIFRPMGLTDTPGGAAWAGMISFVTAAGILLTSRNTWLRVAAAGSMLNGTFCIYLSQVRSVLIMLIVCVIAMGALLVAAKRFREATQLGLATLAALFLGTIWAFASGGEAVSQRVMTLFAEDPTTVYMRNRGGFLMYTLFYVIPEYPFGAGLGRWGMIYNYLGRYAEPTQTVWSEIIWTGWVYDGGVPVFILYGTAVGLALWFSAKVALRHHDRVMANSAAVLFGYNVACLAVTFNTNLFVGQGGIEFWIFNATLAAAFHSVKRPPSKAVPANSNGAPR